VLGGLLVKVMEYWLVPNDVMVRGGALCDQTVNAVATINKPQVAVVSKAVQFFFIVFIFMSVVDFQKGWMAIR
jgi:hypothetical protein